MAVPSSISTDHSNPAPRVVRGVRTGIVVPFPPVPRGRAGREDRAFLFLQGPVGPFFGHLAHALIEQGCRVDRVRFHSGDRHYRRSDPRRNPRFRAVNYGEGDEALGAWLRGAIWRNGYAAIVLFGAERPAHRIARMVAKTMNVPVIALEEGYIRGGHVTVERGGNNLCSPLAGRLPPDTFTGAPTKGIASNGFWRMIWYGFRYYGRRNLFSWLQASNERTLYHKKRSSTLEVAKWARNLGRWAIRKGKSVEAITALGVAYDVVPLQVHDDAQLGEAALGWSNSRLIIEAIESFAKHAPSDRHVVFKTHPLERGHTSDHKLIDRLAEQWGVADRVHWIMTGNLNTLVRSARGMIVINSTSGLTALDFGKPLLVLGRAIYAHPELARCNDASTAIDAFWQDDFVAPRELRSRFKHWLASEALVPGDLYDRRVREQTVANVAARVIELAAEPVVEPARPPWWAGARSPEEGGTSAEPNVGSASR